MIRLSQPLCWLVTMPRIPLAVLLLALAAPGARVAAQQGEATTLVTGPVTVTARDEFARGLIQRAIARKHEVYAGIHDYRYDAYVKFVVRDLVRHADSAASVVLITETRTSAYWEQPDHYQETILARRQSNNLSAERNLV